MLSIFISLLTHVVLVVVQAVHHHVSLHRVKQLVIIRVPLVIIMVIHVPVLRVSAIVLDNVHLLLVRPQAENEKN